jgi:hypothetical protein
MMCVSPKDGSQPVDTAVRVDSDERAQTRHLNAVVFVLGIWVSVLLGYVLTASDADVISTQQGLGILVTNNLVNSTYQSTTSVFGRNFLLLFSEVQSYVSELVLFELFLVVLLFAFFWLAYSTHRVEESYHPRTILFYLYIVVLVVFLYVPFAMKAQTINALFLFRTGLNGAPIQPGNGVSTDVISSLIGITTNSASSVVFASYFLESARLIIVIGIFWISLLPRASNLFLRGLRLFLPPAIWAVLFCTGLVSIYTPLVFSISNLFLVQLVDSSIFFLSVLSLMLWGLTLWLDYNSGHGRRGLRRR